MGVYLMKSRIKRQAENQKKSDLFMVAYKALNFNGLFTIDFKFELAKKEVN